MLFNSFEFIFVFLPLIFVGYFLINKAHPMAGKVWLLIGSLFFYSWWNPIYLPLLLLSLIVNFPIGRLLSSTSILQNRRRKLFLWIGIIFNICLLGFFKYYDFFVSNLNFALKTDFNLLHFILPLAISFYTFQQIAFLIDSYRDITKERNFINYALFISFFPQLIAGPIVNHQEVIGQYNDPKNYVIRWDYIAKGLFIFSIGLFKKVAIADMFAIWANQGFLSAGTGTMVFFDGWVTSLAYTFQLYFDFSGYTDMAIGASLLFNIRLPINFNSPYKAVSIQDFWKRWHITLTRFLTQYIYIPLGGSRISNSRTYVNVFLIFLISGFWHGAGWTFIIWGSLHGLASVINRAWTRAGFKMYRLLGWFVTFQFINATWVIFRAPDFTVAKNILAAMFGLHGFELPVVLANRMHLSTVQTYMYTLTDHLNETLIYLACGLIIVLCTKNVRQLSDTFKPKITYAVYAAILFIYAALHLQNVSEFLYFNF